MMDVRLGTSNNSPMQAPPVASVRETGGTSQEQAPSVIVSKREFPGHADAEEVNLEVEKYVSTRNDGIGLLFQQVYGYVPPSMPSFRSGTE